MGLTYQSAGVNLELYEQAMSRLPALMQRTHTPRVMPLADGFAGLFHLGSRKKYRRNYKDPVLVSGTDGVGTKLKVATKCGVHRTVGIDLVAMSVNDCLCLGAEPLFFLDYLALGKDDPDLIAELVSGVSAGCVDAGAALIGGETAIMPDLYGEGEYDLAGFCVAVAERKELIDGKSVQAGDVVIGLPSTGLHSNGYSLARKVVDRSGLRYADLVPELGETLGEALLKPTRIYVRAVLDVLTQLKRRKAVHGLAHITGGGLVDNIVRILPDGVQLQIDCATWQRPAIFDWLQTQGDVDRDEMYRVFNMGIGFVLIVKPKAADSVLELLEQGGCEPRRIGSVIAGEKAVVLTHSP